MAGAAYEPKEEELSAMRYIKLLLKYERMRYYEEAGQECPYVWTSAWDYAEHHDAGKNSVMKCCRGGTSVKSRHCFPKSIGEIAE